MVNGLDIVDDMDEIRKSMGVCPQHDILWSELTAIEHLRLFAKLKGIETQFAEEEIEKRLKQMGLFNVVSIVNHRLPTRD
jgi:ABC-type multidrug transport system ATPase subunit